MNNSLQNILLKPKSALGYRDSSGYSFQRQLLHEMSHANDLNPIHGVNLSSSDELKSFGVNSSRNAFFCDDEIEKYIEVVADAISMVAYKNIPDKSSAFIEIPILNEYGNYKGYEIVDYDEWCNRFRDLVDWLEKELNLMMKMQFNNMIRVNGPNKNLIKLSDLLKLFELNLGLSNELLDVKVDGCFKSSELTINNDSYEFRVNDYSLIITPSDLNQNMIISEEQDFRDSPLRMFYNDSGVLYKIT